MSIERFKEYHKLGDENQYLGIRSKSVVWNGVDSYVVYATDESEEYNRNHQQRELLNRVPAGIGIYTYREGHITQEYVNDAFYEIIGETRESRQNRQNGDFMKMVYVKDRPDVEKAIEKLINGDNGICTAHRILCGDGTYRWLRLNATVVNRQGNEITAYCSYTDIHEMMQARQKIEKADIALRQEYAREQQKREFLERDAVAVMTLNITLGVIADYSTRMTDSRYIHSGMKMQECLDEVAKRLSGADEQALLKKTRS